MNPNQTKISRDVLQTLEEKASRVDLLIPILEEAMVGMTQAAAWLTHSRELMQRGEALEAMLTRIVQEEEDKTGVLTPEFEALVRPTWLDDAKALLEKLV